MKVKFPTTRFFSAGSAFLSTALRWWWQGLSAFWPQAFRSFTTKTQPVVWHLDLPLAQINLSKEKLINARIDRGSNVSSSAFIEPLSETTPLLIKLHTDDLLFLTLILPTSTQSKLQEAVSFQLITEAPLSRADLYFDSRVIRRSDKHQIEVKVYICKKETVHTLATWIEQQGFVNFSIGFASTPEANLDSVFYTSPAIKSAQSRSRKILLLSISLMTSLLAFSPFFYIAATIKTHTLNRQNNELQVMVNRYADLLAQRSLQEAIAADLKKQLPNHRLTNVLNEIADLMPATSWLTSIKFDQGVVQVVGNAAKPTDMMQALTHFSAGQVKLVSVANQPNNSTPTQFEISVQLQ